MNQSSPIRNALLPALALCLASGGLFAKEGRLPVARGSAPAVSVISGSPLTVRIGDEHSYQVLNADVPGVGQIYPSGSTGTADMGWLVAVESAPGSFDLHGPDFPSHSSGSATGSLGAVLAYTGRTLSGVSGAGTVASPYRVTVQNTLGGTSLSTSEVVEYVNGENYYTTRFTLTNDADSAQTVRVFLGADIYLAGDDSGVPYLDAGLDGVGGSDCATPAEYFILLIPETPSDSYSGAGYSSIWSQIGTSALDGALSGSSCIDNGAALQWNRLLAPHSSTTVSAIVSFGDIPDVGGFDVRTVSPGSSLPGTTLDVTVGGTGFEPGMTFDFGAGITVTNVNVIDANTAIVTIVIAPAATPGTRDVTGTLTGATPQSDTAPNAFVVLSPGGGGQSGAVPAPVNDPLALALMILTLLAGGWIALQRRG